MSGIEYGDGVSRNVQKMNGKEIGENHTSEMAVAVVRPTVQR